MQLKKLLNKSAANQKTKQKTPQNYKDVMFHQPVVLIFLSSSTL